jgi:hypothetical protein
MERPIELTPELVSFYECLDRVRNMSAQTPGEWCQKVRALSGITTVLENRYFDAPNEEGQIDLGLRLRRARKLLVQVVDKKRGLTLSRAQEILELIGNIELDSPS